MAATYAEYRTSEAQFMRYFDVLKEFMSSPTTALYCPVGVSPMTAETDLRVLCQDMAIEPQKYTLLPFPLLQIQTFHLHHAFRHTEEGVYCIRRTRRLRFSYRREEKATKELYEQEEIKTNGIIVPVILRGDCPNQLSISTEVIKKLKQEKEEKAGILAPLNKQTAHLRSVHNPRAVVTICRAIMLQAFKEPIEMDGVMTDEELDSYTQKFPQLEFHPRETTTLIL